MEVWRFMNRLPLLIFVIFYLFFDFCCSLNDEGLALLRFKEAIVSDPYGALFDWAHEVGVETPCSWNGVECSAAGHVTALDLKDLGLEGSVAADIGDLIHIKSLSLCNNSFYGVIPEEIKNLRELDVLDLRHNNFSSLFSCYRLGNSLSSKIINELLCCATPKIFKIQIIPEVVSKQRGASFYSRLLTRNSEAIKHLSRRRISHSPNGTLQGPSRSRSLHSHSSRSTLSPAPAPAPTTIPTQALFPFPTFSSPLNPNGGTTSSRFHHRSLIMAVAIATPLLLVIILLSIFFIRYGKVASVNPWIRGLSGQLQKETVTGIPEIKRSEIEAACEDFSNVIGSFSAFRLYKGTLASGVEVAVLSIAVESAKNWSSSLQAQFWKKIEMLSKVKHKNFVSLLSYCEEEGPFTRMLVFEYAPNGTLFEHLHNSTVREAEPLDWSMRLRIAMGIAYCLDHMHHLQPPLAHLNINSSAIYLTEDYAAKVSDFVLCEKDDGQTNMSSDVYSFGILLFEMISGKPPKSAGNGFLEDWAVDYLSELQQPKKTIDPYLRTYDEDQLRKINEVIKICVEPQARHRPTIREVCTRLREITNIAPYGAIPKLSPLWLVELDITG